MSDWLTWAILIYLGGIPLIMGACAAFDDDPETFVPAALFWPLFIIFMAAFVVGRKAQALFGRKPAEPRS